jgi:hypothetical protein
MKRLFVASVISMLFIGIAGAQVLPVPSVKKLNKDSVQTTDTLVYRPNIDLNIGWAPNPDYNNFKFSASINRLLFKTVGFYTSVEKGISSDYFTNIWGLTYSMHRYFYFFGGLDLFTDQNGLIPHGWSGIVRKEVGVGLYPYKNWVIRLSSSFDVATAITIGYCIPIRNKNKSSGSTE